MKTERPPRIDGFIESVWAEADSVTEFVQTEPREGQPATERTVAYFLYDDQNLYVAFKCYDSEPEELVVVVGPRGDASGDHVHFFIDTFGNKVTAYEFRVNAAGVQDDFCVFSDGEHSDKGWEGVWYSAAKVTDFGYVVEVKIPFKSLRYKKGLSRWGIGFERWICRKEERAHWLPQKSGQFRISRLAQLEGIRPGEMGLHLELYPVALARYDRPSTSPDAGLDFSWHPTSSSSFHFTANPDFAQVEADPYQINLSKYETYLAERRPFFVEGSDLFDLRAVRAFYSRRIGKRLPGGEEVPILGGSKFIARPGRFEIGALSALTGEVKYTDDD
ncbi:MAG: carbohydrate binding family 9 domain-containing protein, partial [Candidatus Latescibacteria bacterium]|nr:carbohydrate binding family 9 domain-containing protein [Candidatus Latescibacterota bacterium]